MDKQITQADVNTSQPEMLIVEERNTGLTAWIATESKFCCAVEYDLADIVYQVWTPARLVEVYDDDEAPQGLLDALAKWDRVAEIDAERSGAAAQRRSGLL